MNPNVSGRDEIAMGIMKSIGLTNSDIKKLYRKFCDVDLDGSGDVRHDEFFAYFHIENSTINRRIFEVCDVDKSGVLNFCEFVLAVWNLLSMNSESISSFIFFLFDDDHTGTLNFREIRQLVETIHHKSYNNNKAVKKLIEQLYKISKALTVTQFIDWARQNPPICAPLISLQYRLRVDIYGEGYWEELQARRWRSGDKLAPDYIIKVNQRYMAQMEAKKRLDEMNSTLRQSTPVTASVEPTQTGGAMSGLGPEEISDQKKKAFADQKSTSMTSLSGLRNEVIFSSPLLEEVPVTIQRTLTRILDESPSGHNGDVSDATKVTKKKRKKKKKKKKKAVGVEEVPPKIKFLPPVQRKSRRAYRARVAPGSPAIVDHSFD